jgi:hypothetical protein
VAWSDPSQGAAGAYRFDAAGDIQAHVAPPSPLYAWLRRAQGPGLLFAESEGDDAVLYLSRANDGDSGAPRRVWSLPSPGTLSLQCAQDAPVCVVANMREDENLTGALFLLRFSETSNVPVVTHLLNHKSRLHAITGHSVEACATTPTAAWPRPDLSADGRTLLFSSNWGDNCFAELYAVHIDP